jgi:hypothetical protein
MRDHVGLWVFTAAGGTAAAALMARKTSVLHLVRIC